MKALLVDDEIVSLQAMLAGVAWADCGVEKVLTAHSIEEAKSIFIQEQPDLLLLDIEMPGGSGLELLSWVREQGYEDIACAFLTCHPDFSYAVDALRLGSFDYVLKPVEYTVLETLVRKMVHQTEEFRKSQKLKEYRDAYVREKTVDAEHSREPALNTEGIVEETSQYILTHLSEKLKVDDLANRVHLNADYLNRLFRRQKGIPINKFIIRERMELAAKLLKESNLSAIAVAQEVGYQNYSNFAVKFREYFGVNPGKKR